MSDLPFRRRDFLKAGTAGTLLSSLITQTAVAGGDPEQLDDGSETAAESDDIELDNGIISVIPPTTIERNNLITEISRDGEEFFGSRSTSTTFRDETEEKFQLTEIINVEYTETSAEITRRKETPENEIESVVSMELADDLPGLLINHEVENVSNNPITFNMPSDFIGREIDVGGIGIGNPGDNYRFSVRGDDPILFEDTFQFESFDLSNSVVWATTFDDDQAVTYGYDSTNGATDTNLAMVSRSVTRIRQFSTGITLQPGEIAEWRTAAVAHDGGDNAIETGSELVQDVLEMNPPSLPEDPVLVLQPLDVADQSVDNPFSVSVTVEETAGETLTGGEVTLTVTPEGATDPTYEATIGLSELEDEETTVTFGEDNGTDEVVVEEEGEYTAQAAVEAENAESVSKSTEFTVDEGGTVLVVDAEADPDDPEYPTISGAVDDATDKDTIEVRAGMYDESVSVDVDVDIVATGDVTVVSASEEGPVFKIDAEVGAEPHIEGVKITGGDTGIDATGTDTDWTVTDTVITDSAEYSLNADDTTGDWKVTDSEILVGVTASGSAGDWRIETSDIKTDSEITEAVDASSTTGDWQITGPTTLVGSAGLNANMADGDWSVHRTNFETTDWDISTDGDTTVGNARRNWYDGDNPTVQGEENVFTGNILGEPASEDATGLEVTVRTPTNEGPDNGGQTPLAGARVYLFTEEQFNPDPLPRDLDSAEEYLSALDESEPTILLEQSEFEDQATRLIETIDDGIVRYTDVDPGADLHLIVEPSSEPSRTVLRRVQAVVELGVQSETVIDIETTHPEGVQFSYLFDSNLFTQTELLDQMAKNMFDAIQDKREKVLKVAHAQTNDLPIDPDLSASDAALWPADIGDFARQASKNKFDKGTFTTLLGEIVVSAYTAHKLRTVQTARLIDAEGDVDVAANKLDTYTNGENLGQEGEESPFEKPLEPDRPDPDYYEDLKVLKDTTDKVVDLKSHVKSELDSEPLQQTVYHPAVIRTIETITQRVPELSVQPGNIPQGMILMPDGTVRETLKGVEPLQHMLEARNKMETADQWGAEIAQGISILTTGIAVVLAAGAVVGSFFTGGSSTVLLPLAKSLFTIGGALGAGATGLNFLQGISKASNAEILLEGYFGTHVLTLHDIENYDEIRGGIPTWLNSLADGNRKLTGPISARLDKVTVTDPDIENPLPEMDELVANTDGPQALEDGVKEAWKGQISVTAQNTSTDEQPIRVLNYGLTWVENSFSQSGNIEWQAQTKLGMSPSIDEEAYHIPSDGFTTSAGMDARIETEMDARIETDLENPYTLQGFEVVVTAGAIFAAEFSWRGKIKPVYPDDEEEDGSSVTDEATARQRSLPSTGPKYATASTGDISPLTASQSDPLQTSLEKVIDTELPPGDTESVTITPSGDFYNLAVSASGVPNGEKIILEVTDTGSNTSKTATGSTPTLSFESVTGELEVTVTVPTRAMSAQPVTVRAIETPQRPAILGFPGSQVTAAGSPDTTVRAGLRLVEAGNQQPITGIEISAGQLNNAAGTALPEGTLTIENPINTLPATERALIDVSIDVPPIDELDVAGEPTRFSGDITVETGNAGSLDVLVSTLVLDTTLEEAELLWADSAVTTVRLKETTVSGAPSQGEVQNAYTVTVDTTGGDGSATVQLPDPLRREGTEPFLLIDGEYEPIRFGADDEAGSVTVPTGENTIVVVDLGPPALPDFENPPQDLDGDGLYEDIDGDGEFDIFDVQAFFINFGAPVVQNHPEAFNFDEDENPEDVTIFDVQGLFNRLQGWDGPD